MRSPRVHRIRDVKSSRGGSIIALRQKSRRLIRRVLAYVPAMRGKNFEKSCEKRRRRSSGDFDTTIVARIIANSLEESEIEKERNKEIANFITRFDIPEIPAPNRYVTRVR